MYLEDVLRNIAAHGRYHRHLIRTRGDHHVGGFNRAVVGREKIAAGTLCSLQRSDFHSAARRSFDERRVVFDETHDFPTRRESLWIGALVFVAGQFDRPVGKLEAERIPPLAAPTLTYSRSFEDHMLSPKSTEVITHRQTGMTAAYDDRIDLFLHGIPSKGSGFRPALFERYFREVFDHDDRLLVHGANRSF